MRLIRKIKLLKVIVVVMATALTVGLTGCDTKNIGSYGPGGGRGGPSVTFQVPTTGLFGFETSTWVATWDDNLRYVPNTDWGPYTIAWNFGGGADNIPASAATSPATVDVTWVDSLVEQTYAVTVTVTDRLGMQGSSSAIVTIGASRVPVPTIESMVVDGSKLIVTASESGNNPLEVRVSGHSGMTVDEPIKVTDTQGTATFTFEATDKLAGANSTVTVTVIGTYGAIDENTSGAIVIAPFAPAPDTLYAIPMMESVAIGDPATILVYTGSTGAFQFMLSVGVVLDSDATYVSDTFNVGAIGGALDDADGVWSAITSNGGFIMGGDLYVGPSANPDDSLGDKQRFDFNISPLGGTDQASVEGALFNFQVTYSSAGEKQIGFQEFNGVNRTFYSDLGSSIDTFWSLFIEGTIIVTD